MFREDRNYVVWEFPWRWYHLSSGSSFNISIQPTKKVFTNGPPLPLRLLLLSHSQVKRHFPLQLQTIFCRGSGCGTADSAVASDDRGPGFDSSHRQLLFNIYLLLTVCRRDPKEENETRNGPFKKHLSKTIQYTSQLVVSLKRAKWTSPLAWKLGRFDNGEIKQA